MLANGTFFNKSKRGHTKIISVDNRW